MTNTKYQPVCAADPLQDEKVDVLARADAERDLWLHAAGLIESQGVKAIDHIDAKLAELAEQNRPEEMGYWFDLAGRLFSLEMPVSRAKRLQ